MQKYGKLNYYFRKTMLCIALDIIMHKIVS